MLAATDGSPHVSVAVNEATTIAKRRESRLIALSAMRDKNQQEEAKNHVGRAVELAQKEGVAAETITPRGRSYDVIVETTGGKGVDSIVMGTYGKT
jgi:nucleotide-binding universal stress UspA family protein